MSYQQHQRRRFVPPEVGSIHRATVTRIEPYGCFVRLVADYDSPTVSGLVHISQLTAITNNGVKISDVNDVVSLDDQVYIKVMDVTIEQTDDGRQRHKFKLSMKYVHQDTGQDLDPDGEMMEQDLMRSQHRSGSGGGGRNSQNSDQDGTGGANSLLGRSLASNIGISSAIDPGSLILKGKSGSSAGGMGNTKFNGYLLVGEDEGEEAPTTSVSDERTTTSAANMTNAAPAVRPMGRGRATTLPAWMTRQDDDRLGSMKGEKGPGDDKVDDGSRGDRHRKKSSRRDKHHRHKDRKRSSSRKHSRKHKKSSRRRSRSRGRSRSESYYSSSDDYSRSRSRSPSYKKKRKKSKHRHRHRGDREDYSRSRSRSRSDSRDLDQGEGRGSTSSPSAFNNVEEARAIMERLERRQRVHRTKQEDA